jgi:hypothetical protein
MRHARAPLFLRSVAWVLLAAGVASCSDDDPGPVNATGTVQGVFKDPGGNPIAGAQVKIFALDTADSNLLESRTLATNAAGQFSTTFSFSTGTFPVDVEVRARPLLGSGMEAILLRDSVLAIVPGRLADTLRYELRAVQGEPPVNDILPAPFAQSALPGKYFGQSVAPLESSVITYLELDVTGTSGSVSGRYDIDYNATLVVPDGTILGAVLLDTLRLQLTSDTIPGEARNVASFKAIATSSTADTLIATPDPCIGQGCWLFVAPLRLIRTP